MSTENNDLDAVLSRTGIGSLIAEYKVASVGLVVLLIVGAIGFSIYQNKSHEGLLEKADEVYLFKKESLEKFNEDKVSADEVVASFNSLWTKVGDFKGLAPVGLELSDELTKKGNKEQSLAVLEKLEKEYANKGVYLKYLIAIRLAAFYEDKNEFTKASELLESVLGSKVKVMEERLRLDLARLYFQANNPEKAKLNLNHVIEKSKDNQLTGVAQALKLKYGL